MRSLRLLLAAAAVALAGAGAARAEIVTAQDDQGRTITLDVQAPGDSVDTGFYAAVLRGALHGDEIERVTVRIVPFRDVQWQCGAGAEACYFTRRGGATIVVPAGTGSRVAETLLHEYGHHVDATRPVDGVEEPNGTATWWTSRGMAALVDSGDVTGDYGLGWDRSIAEIFAEDYVQAHLAAPYAIRWLAPPDDTVKKAITDDLGGAPPTLPAIAPTPPTPLTVTRSGSLRPGQRRTLPFTLLGPNRRVTFVATVAGAKRKGIRARMEIVCDGRRTAARSLRRGQARGKLDRRGLGPAQCEIALRSTTTVAHRYVVRLTLTIEDAA